MLERDAARQLWRDNDPTAWQDALDSYPAVVAAQGERELEELDDWYRLQLPKALAARQPAELSPDELRDVVRWKMKRGEWRARNLALLAQNSDEEIRQATRRGFAAAPHERKPLEEIAALSGVGPATASAVMAAFRPHLYPFLDELVGAAIEGLGPPKFTLPYYLRYADALRTRASELGPDWDAQRVGLALWAAAGGKAPL